MSIIDKSTEDQIKVEIQGSTVEGDMAVTLKDIVTKRLDEKIRDVHMDLSEVKYFDSASIGALLYFIQFLKKENKVLVIENRTNEIKDLFDSLLLDQFLEYA